MVSHGVGKTNMLDKVNDYKGQNTLPVYGNCVLFQTYTGVSYFDT